MFTFLFWFMLLVLVYTYAGYALLLFLTVTCRRIMAKKRIPHDKIIYEPEVCLFVTAYNEEAYVDEKIANSFNLDYPADKIQFLWITDGSSDSTLELLKKYPRVEVYHQPERKGKINAMNRGMKFVRTPYVVFSDSNSMLSQNTIREMMACFKNPEVGCVAGEKRIVQKEKDSASGAGEGLYWKFESVVKRLDAELNSAVGGVGELFAIRTSLFEPVEKDTILDDFVISLRIAAKGYRIAYTPNGYAEESASLNVKEELKRKIRIAAGGVQTMIRLSHLLNPFKYGILSWQFFSHKVLRWSVSPFFFFLIFPVNLVLVIAEYQIFEPAFPVIALWLQLIFYVFALLGSLFEHHKLRMKLFFAPYYFIAINYASVVGIIRSVRGKQKVTWEKSRRA